MHWPVSPFLIFAFLILLRAAHGVPCKNKVMCAGHPIECDRPDDIAYCSYHAKLNAETGVWYKEMSSLLTNVNQEVGKVHCSDPSNLFILCQTNCNKYEKYVETLLSIEPMLKQCHVAYIRCGMGFVEDRTNANAHGFCMFGVKVLPAGQGTISLEVYAHAAESTYTVHDSWACVDAFTERESAVVMCDPKATTGNACGEPLNFDKFNKLCRWNEKFEKYLLAYQSQDNAKQSRPSQPTKNEWFETYGIFVTVPLMLLGVAIGVLLYIAFRKWRQRVQFKERTAHRHLHTFVPQKVTQKPSQAAGSEKDESLSTSVKAPSASFRAAAATSSSGRKMKKTASKPTMKEKMSFLCCNELYADVVFIVGECESIPAHKLILSMGSAVFDAMLNGGLAASGEQEIKVPDVEPSAFRNLLSFIYTEEVNVDRDNVMGTLNAAKKYAILPLEKICVDFLMNNISAEDVLVILKQAQLFDERELEDLCWKFIDFHAHQVIAAEGVSDVDRGLLRAVLERDTLRTSEQCVFQAVCRWAEAECLRRGEAKPTPEQQRAAISDLLPLVRFPLLPDMEILNARLLYKEEIRNLSKHFSTKPRRKPPGSEMVVNRFVPVGFSDTARRRSGGASEPDKIDFTVDRDICITALGLYVDRTAEHAVTIQILQEEEVLASRSTSITCDSSDKYKVEFVVPVDISAGVTYTACAHFEDDYRFPGENGKKAVRAHGGACFRFSDSTTLSTGNTNVQRGQIPHIYYVH